MEFNFPGLNMELPLVKATLTTISAVMIALIKAEVDKHPSRLFI
jgi:hypothetical protein